MPEPKQTPVNPLYVVSGKTPKTPQEIAQEFNVEEEPSPSEPPKVLQTVGVPPEPEQPAPTNEAETSSYQTFVRMLKTIFHDFRQDHSVRVHKRTGARSGFRQRYVSRTMSISTELAKEFDAFLQAGVEARQSNQTEFWNSFWPLIFKAMEDADSISNKKPDK